MLAALALVLLVTLAYADALFGQLVLDAYSLIHDDLRISGVQSEHLWEIFRQNYWWPSWESDLYRPLTTFSFLCNYSILGSGTHPFGYHLVDLTLHVANTLLVFQLFRLVLGRMPIALVAAAAFGVHPLTTEVVANVAGRADLLATLFLLAALLLHARWWQNGSGRWTRTGLFACALAAASSKETGVVLIALAVIFDFTMRPQTRTEARTATPGTLPPRSVYLDYVAVLAAGGIYLTARYFVLRHTPVLWQIGSDNPLVLGDFWSAKMTAFKVLGYYLALVLWPAKLSCDYSYRQVPLFGGSFSGPDLDGWIGLAMVVLLAAAAIYGIFHNRRLFFFLTFAALTILPTANLLFPIGTIMGERLMYLPLIGCIGALATLAIPLIDAARRRWPSLAGPTGRIVAGVLSAALLVPLAARTCVRNLDWHDNVAIWRAAVRTCPDSFKVYKGLANALWQRDQSYDDLDEIIALAKRGLKIIDDHPLPTVDSPTQLLLDLTMYYQAKGDRSQEQAGSGRLSPDARECYEQGLAYLERAVVIDQAVNAASRAMSLARGRDPDTIYDVGQWIVYRWQASLQLRLRNLDAAIEGCRSLRRLAPGDAETYRVSAIVNSDLGRTEAAARDYLRTMALGGATPQLYRELAPLLASFQAQPAPVIEQGGRFALNTKNGTARRMLDDALVELVRYTLEARHREEAEQFVELAVRKFQVPRERFEPLFSPER